MRPVKFEVFAMLVFCSISIPSVARAGEATNQLSVSINEFMAILTSIPVAELEARGLPESARKLVFARFDFFEMTKRSLGAHWNSLGQGERREFVEAFTERLLVSYGKTVRSSERNKINFGREVREGKQAKVETMVVHDEGEDLPIDYRLHDIDGQWKVYDVVIEHVSLVNNYRAQFNRVIAKSSVKELLQKLKDVN